MLGIGQCRSLGFNSRLSFAFGAQFYRLVGAYFEDRDGLYFYNPPGFVAALVFKELLGFGGIGDYRAMESDAIKGIADGNNVHEKPPNVLLLILL